MKYCKICLYILIITVLNGMSGYGQRLPAIDKNDTTLKDIIHNGRYDLKRTHILDDDFQAKALDGLAKNGADAINCDSCFIQTFIQWCNNFLQDRRCYLVFGTPLFDRVDEELWGSDEIMFNEFKIQGSEVVFDPFYDNIRLNDYILDNKIIINVKTQKSSDQYDMYLYALIPFEKKYYICSFYYELLRQIKFENFRTTNYIEICAQLGSYIENNPNEFLGADGKLSGNFLMNNFKWTPYSVGPGQIKQIDLHPESEPITLKSLFYNLR